MSTYTRESFPARRWMREVAAWVLPGACLLCGCRCGSPSLCERCEVELPRADLNACDACALPMPEGTRGRCGACLNEHLPYRRARSPFSYEDDVAWLIRRYKFRGNLAAGHALARCMAHAMSLQTTSEPPGLLVPVPLHEQRLRERGFDQAVELARHLGSFLRLQVCPALKRLRATTAQTSSVDVPSRRRNLRGAFSVARPQLVAGKHVSVIDDVMTTGATASYLAKLLQNAGVKRVDVWLIARTP